MSSSSKPTGGTPIWVWVVYSLGILAAAIFAFSILFTAGAYLLSDDVDVTFDVSTRATPKSASSRTQFSTS